MHTPRLVLRRLCDYDLDDFLAYRNDPEVARYQNWECFTRAEAAAFITRHHAQTVGEPGQWLQIAVASRKTDQLVGDCALKVHAEDQRQATIGVTFSRINQGRGFATEALTALLDDVFNRMQMHRVIADTDPENVAAWRLMERLGMRREAHLKQSLWFKGHWVDEYLYAILDQEWRQFRTTANQTANAP